MAAVCVTPIKGRVARLVKLDTCGNPVTGASSAVVVVDGFISIAPTMQYEDGEEFVQKNASGALCVNQKDPSQLKRVQLAMTWCVMDPDAITIQTGERLLTTSATGTGVAFSSAVNTARFSLEIWQNVAGRAACNASGQQQYVYWAFPNVGNVTIGDFSIENAPLQFVTNGETDFAGPLWGDGPGSAGPWLPSSLLTTEQYAYNVTTVAPPSATCGAALLS